MGKKNKAQTIVETEPVVIEEEAIIDSTEVKEDEVIDVEAPEVIVEETKVALEVVIAFSDKYTNVDYNIGDVITVDNDRAKELLDDDRKLVKKR